MSLTTRILEGTAPLASIAAAWDEIPPSRGIQADLYDTYTWFAAWSATQPEATRQRVRVVAAFDQETLCAVVPLLEVSRGAWESVAKGFRPRFRPVIAGGCALDETCAALAEAVARAGVRELSLPGVPSRDPASTAFADALQASGYAVARHPGPQECLTPVVAGGWEEHRRAFKKYDRTVKNFSNKAGRLGAVTTEYFGPAGPAPSDGFESYLALHALGWKGSLREPMLSHRRELLKRAGDRGLAHLFLMRVANVPAAAIVWFRVGSVAIAYSTVYDQRLAALSAGTIVMWHAHEVLLGAGEIALIDYLPGRGPQKDHLGLETPPLQRLEATRRSMVGGWISPLKRIMRRAASAAAQRVRDSRRDTASTEESRLVACRSQAVLPDNGHSPAQWVSELDPRTELFLTVAGGYNSPAAMIRTWNDGDQWWRVGGDAPSAFVRVGSGIVREIVCCDDTDATDAAESVAAAQRASLQLWLADDTSPINAAPTSIRRAPLPWDQSVSTK
ncbi:MAG: GNAT family N-acetyltransferase [Acidobacteriota bacterium]